MKDYLNQDELNDFMLISCMLDTTGKILGIETNNKSLGKIGQTREGWNKRNNLTKEEHKSLKMAETHLTKFFESVLSRLDHKEVDKIGRKYEKFIFRIMDEYTLKKLNGDLNEKLSIVKIDRESFQDWCSEIMDVNCKNCNNHHSECKLCTLFEDNFIPESTWRLSNCRYAYQEIKEKIG